MRGRSFGAVNRRRVRSLECRSVLIGISRLASKKEICNKERHCQSVFLFWIDVQYSIPLRISAFGPVIPQSFYGCSRGNFGLSRSKVRNRINGVETERRDLPVKQKKYHYECKYIYNSWQMIHIHIRKWFGSLILAKL